MKNFTILNLKSLPVFLGVCVLFFLWSPIEGTVIRNFDLYFGDKLKNSDDMDTVKWAIRRYGNKSHEKFKYYVFRAAELGDANYQHVYGDILIDEMNSKEGIEWLTRAAEQGWKYSAIQLGKIYDEGEFVEANYKKAKKYFEQAANSGLLSAKLKLAEYYANGLGGSVDIELALRLLSDPAIQKNPIYNEKAVALKELILKRSGAER